MNPLRHRYHFCGIIYWVGGNLFDFSASLSTREQTALVASVQKTLYMSSAISVLLKPQHIVNRQLLSAIFRNKRSRLPRHSLCVAAVFLIAWRILLSGVECQHKPQPLAQPPSMHFQRESTSCSVCANGIRKGGRSIQSVSAALTTARCLAVLAEDGAEK